MPESPDKELQSGPAAGSQLPPTQSEWAAQWLPGYAELHCISNFSFQRGASHPEELVQRAYQLGYEALAITDECSVAGVVRAHVGLKHYLEELEQREREQPQEGPLRHPFKLLLGSEFVFPEGRLVAIARAGAACAGSSARPAWGRARSRERIGSTGTRATCDCCKAARSSGCRCVSKVHPSTWKPQAP
jgi:hypothetical protein